MPEVSSEVIDDILRRLAAAEARPRRASFNQKQAAEYLNRSEEWLRREHLAGRGPKRRKRGRYWDYALTDLEHYRENGERA